MFWSMILHIYCKKNRPKNVHSFFALRGKLQENEQLECPFIQISVIVWITACHGRVHEKWPKDTEET